MALRMPSARVLLRLVKKLTVIGIMEYTQGVSTASKPPSSAPKKRVNKDPCLGASVFTVGAVSFFAAVSVLLVAAIVPFSLEES